MATYTPTQMAGSGILSTQSFTSGSTVTITITNKPSREVGSAYFTISAPTQDPTLPLYFVGSTFVPTNVDDIVVDTPKPIVLKAVKKDTQVKQKEVEPVKDSNTVNPTQDSLKP